MMKGNSRRKEVERAVFLLRRRREEEEEEATCVEVNTCRSLFSNSQPSLSFFKLPVVALFCYFVTICSPSRAKALSATVAQSWLIYVKHLRSEAESNLI